MERNGITREKIIKEMEENMGRTYTLETVILVRVVIGAGVVGREGKSGRGGGGGGSGSGGKRAGGERCGRRDAIRESAVYATPREEAHGGPGCHWGRREGKKYRTRQARLNCINMWMDVVNIGNGKSSCLESNIHLLYCFVCPRAYLVSLHLVSGLRRGMEKKAEMEERERKKREER